MEFEKDKMYILNYFFTKVTNESDFYPYDSSFPREAWTIHPDSDIKHWLTDDDDVIEGFVIIKYYKNQDKWE